MPKERNERKTAATANNRLWSPVFIVILACTLFAFLVGQGLNAGTSVYLERMGGSIGLAGMGALFFSVSAAVARILSGTAIDSRGRRIVISTGAVFLIIGTVCPLIENTGAFFMVWRILQGIGFSATTTALATAAADVLPFKRLGEGVGYYGLGQALSMAVGPALAVSLASSADPANFYIGCAVCACSTLVLSLFISYEKHPQALPETSEYRTRWESGEIGKGALEQTLESETVNKPAWKRMLENIFEPKAVPAALTILFMCAGFSFNIFYMGVYGSALGIENAGIYYTVLAVVMIAVRLGAGRFMDTVPPIKLMGVAVVTGIIAFAELALCAAFDLEWATQWIFYSAGIPFGICMGLAIPVNQTIAVRMSPAARWGAANALFMLAIDMGNGLLSLLWGFLIDGFGFTAVFVCIIACIIAGFITALAVYPATSK